MEEHELRESLRRLPDARPGAEFTAEVLARVERDERGRVAGDGRGATDRARGGAARWRPTLLAAGLAAALVAAAGLWQPPAGYRWLGGGGGGEVAAPEAARAERPGEEGGGGPADGGGGASSVGAVTGELGEGASPSDGDLADAAVAVEGAGEAPAVAPVGGPEGSSRDGAAPAPTAPPAAGTPSDVDIAAAPPGADFFAAPPTAAPTTATPPAALPAAARLARLRAERESLERRLADFRRELPPAEPPVVLLGGDDGIDLVFDLARWAAPPPAASSGRGQTQENGT